MIHCCSELEDGRVAPSQGSGGIAPHGLGLQLGYDHAEELGLVLGRDCVQGLGF